MLKSIFLDLYDTNIDICVQILFRFSFLEMCEQLIKGPSYNNMYPLICYNTYQSLSKHDCFIF